MPKQPNGVTKKVAKDAEGNLVGCPKCKTNHIRKDGWQYWKNNRKRQRWMCSDCGHKTLNPYIIEKSDFSVQELPIEEMNIDDIIEYRKKRYVQKYDAYKQRQLIDVKINVNGIIGLCHFGDPHVDDDGTNLAEIYTLCNLIGNTEGLFAGNLGDIQNNWVGRLKALHGQQSTTAKESWLISEHFLNSVFYCARS